MALPWLFPKQVLQTDLEPGDATGSVMEAQLGAFDRDVFSHPEF